MLDKYVLECPPAQLQPYSNMLNSRLPTHPPLNHREILIYGWDRMDSTIVALGSRRLRAQLPNHQPI